MGKEQRNYYIRAKDYEPLAEPRARRLWEVQGNSNSHESLCSTSEEVFENGVGLFLCVVIISAVS
jgi:hypothetical protein